MELEIKGLDSLIKKLNASNEMVQAGIKKGSLMAGQRITVDAKVKVAKNTGNLANTIRVEQRSTLNYEETVVSTNSNYAQFIEFGTGPVGKASKKDLPKGLSLTYKNVGWFVNVKDFPDYAKYGFKPIENKDGEQFIYTRGQAAKPFMMPAVRANIKRIPKIFKDTIKTELEKGLK